MATPTEATRLFKNNNLDRQTGKSALTDIKGDSGALANQPAPEPRPIDFPKELRKLAEAVERIGRFRDPEDAVMAQIAIIERLEELANVLEVTGRD